MNDNQNGTLSIVGSYNQLLPGYNYCSPLIISQNPLDKNEPPMVASKAPGYVRVDNTNVKPQPQPQLMNHTTSVPSRPARATQMNGVETSDTHSGAKRIWNYILPFLPPSLDPDIFDIEIVRLFALPLLQSVHWRKTWMKRRLDNDRSQIFGILVHVLGVERKTGSNENPCSVCTRGEGPFEGCWTLPRDAAWESHKHAMCCANCLFNHKRSGCSVKLSWERRCDTKPGEKMFPGSPPPVGEWAASATSANSSGQSKKRRLSASNTNEGVLAQRRRYERNQDAENEEQARVGKELVTLPLPSSKRTTRASDSPTRGNTSSEPQTKHSESFPSMSPSALVMAGQQTSDEMLEMEDWEVAPGRIREEGADQVNSKSRRPSLM